MYFTKCDRMIRCRFCGKRAVEVLKQYRLSLCKDCYVKFYERQVERAVKKYKVVKSGERVLACVSGGKDSSAMLAVMKSLSETADFKLEAMFIDLGIGDYSEKSLNVAEKLCKKLDVKLNVVRLSDYGIRLENISTKRKKCSACGTAKRYLMNRFARENGFDCVATGHTSDDILAFFFKNWLSGNFSWSAKFLPRTEGFDKMVTKVRPLYFSSERENLLYCVCRGVPFLNENCPYAPSKDVWKDIIYDIERKKPGFKRCFVMNLVKYLKLKTHTGSNGESYRYCRLCGEITTSDICAFCRLKQRNAPVK